MDAYTYSPSSLQHLRLATGLPFPIISLPDVIIDVLDWINLRSTPPRSASVSLEPLTQLNCTLGLSSNSCWLSIHNLQFLHQQASGLSTKRPESSSTPEPLLHFSSSATGSRLLWPDRLVAYVLTLPVIRQSAAPGRLFSPALESRHRHYQNLQRANTFTFLPPPGSCSHYSRCLTVPSFH